MTNEARAPYAHITELEGRLELESKRRARAEAKLRRLEKALETMQLGVTITDLDGTIVYTNPADARIHGYDVDELIGKDVGMLACPDDRQPLDPAQFGTIATWHRESFNRRKDGTVFPVQLLSDVVSDAQGNPIGLVTTCQDISARKEAELALRESHEQLGKTLLTRAAELAAANDKLHDEIEERRQAEQQRLALQRQLRRAHKLEAVGQLTGGIAHDFNNLLTVVLANAELLITDPGMEPDDRQVLAEDIRDAAVGGSKMIQQLLGFSRDAQLETRPTNLGELVEDTADMLRRLIPENIRLDTTVSDANPIVLADGASVQQMLMNLVTNARDAMPDGGTLRVTVARRTLSSDYRDMYPWIEPGEYICVTATDTGCGMDEATQERVFDPFFTTKPIGEGTGLGLAMIYGLMKQQHGCAELTSELGTGTTVRLYFPASTEPSRPRATTGHTEAPRGRETILLVEDEDLVRSSARRALEQYGYTVLTARDGAEALTLFSAHRDQIDLIVSDLVMPRLGGRGLFEAVRRDRGTVPFLFASGYEPEQARAKAGIAEDTPVLKKPWRLADLAAGVRQALAAGGA